MAVAYVDSSCILAVLFGEPLSAEMTTRLEAHGELFSSNLLEAEVRSAFAREGIEVEPAFLSEIYWVHPNRTLKEEMRQSLSHGYVKGADLWHLATALYLAEVPSELPFLTLDRRQQDVAAALGFPTPLPIAG